MLYALRPAFAVALTCAGLAAVVGRALASVDGVYWVKDGLYHVDATLHNDYENAPPLAYLEIGPEVNAVAVWPPEGWYIYDWIGTSIISRGTRSTSTMTSIVSSPSRDFTLPSFPRTSSRRSTTWWARADTSATSLRH